MSEGRINERGDLPNGNHLWRSQEITEALQDGGLIHLEPLTDLDRQDEDEVPNLRITRTDLHKRTLQKDLGSTDHPQFEEDLWDFNFPPGYLDAVRGHTGMENFTRGCAIDDERGSRWDPDDRGWNI